MIYIQLSILESDATEHYIEALIQLCIALFKHARFISAFFLSYRKEAD